MSIPASVLAAFGLQGPATPLSGGQNQSLLANGVVLKPEIPDNEAAWVAELILSLKQDGFRAPEPVPALDGRWAVESWSAWKHIPGIWKTTQPHEVLKAARALERALAGKPAPAWLNTGQHPWGVADRMVWGEQPLYDNAELMRPIQKLWSLLKPLDLPCQLVHEDVAGNTLFEDGLAPGIIDYSIYWRPAGYGVAIAAVDMVNWFGADTRLYADLEDIPGHLQLLARAELFRVLVYGGFGLSGEALQKRMKDHYGTIEWLCQRLG